MSPSPSRRSLRTRLVWAFGIFSFVLSLTFGLLVLSTALVSEDLLIANLLELEIDEYLARRALDPDTPLPKDRWLDATDDPRDLPPKLAALAETTDGVHELETALPRSVRDQLPEFHLAIRTLDDGSRLYFYLDAAQVEVIDQYFGLVSWTLLAGIAFVTLLGIALGHATARRVITPLEALAQRVEEADPAQPQSLAHDLTDDEVGVLARALETSRARSLAFLERERRFTRDASHELRTPVTVVRGALELLDAQPETESPALRRPIDRIRRANDSMAGLIEAFLWLAREEALAEGVAPQALDHEADEAVARHRHLLAGKEVTVDLVIEPHHTVEAPKGVLGIVLGNLVANAFHFTQRGQVRLESTDSTFEIRDTGPGLAPEKLDTLRQAHRRDERSPGFGLGLAIVGDLCERFGWRLDLDSQEGEGFRARVVFERPETHRQATADAT